jgi:hypothetical protein
MGGKKPRPTRKIIDVPPPGAAEARQRIANLRGAAQSLLHRLAQKHPDLDTVRREYVQAYAIAERIARTHGIAMPGDLQNLYASAIGGFGGMFGGRGSGMQNEAEAELEMMLPRAGL